MIYTIPKNELTFYVDYVIHNNRCYVLQETKDDRVLTKFICFTSKTKCDNLIITNTEIKIII